MLVYKSIGNMPRLSQFLYDVEKGQLCVCVGGGALFGGGGKRETQRKLDVGKIKKV